MLETRVITVNRDAPGSAAIEDAARVIRSGGLVAFPTETVYGLGADATNSLALAKIFEAKGRPATNPLIVHGHDVASVRLAVSCWPETAALLAERFWPGPLTLVLPRSSIIPNEVTAGLGSVGVRVPDCRVAIALLERADRLIAAPSANRSTGVSPTRASHVLKDLGGRVDLILDAGPTPLGLESTVLDLSENTPKLLRPGAITAGQMESVLGRSIEVPPTRAVIADREASATSPGQMEVHYAPRTPILLVEADQVSALTWRPGQRVGLIVFGEEAPSALPAATVRFDWADPSTAGRRLYETFHQCDEDRLDLIVAVAPPDTDEWRAVRDRIWRASRKWARDGGPPA